MNKLLLSNFNLGGGGIVQWTRLHCHPVALSLNPN